MSAASIWIRPSIRIRDPVPAFSRGSSSSAATASAGRSRQGSRTAASGRSPRAIRSRSRVWLWAGVVGLVVIAVVAVVGLFVLGGGSPGHVLVTPNKIGAYVRRPQL